jgi:hypothetical protein
MSFGPSESLFTNSCIQPLPLHTFFLPPHTHTHKLKHLPTHSSTIHSPTHALFYEHSHPLTYTPATFTRLFTRPTTSTYTCSLTHSLPGPLTILSLYISDNSEVRTHSPQGYSPASIMQRDEVALPSGRPCVLQCLFLRFLGTKSAVGLFQSERMSCREINRPWLTIININLKTKFANPFTHTLTHVYIYTRRNQYI